MWGGAEPLNGPLKPPLIPGEASVALRLEDLIPVQLPPPSPFLRGLELEIQIPRTWLQFRYSFAVSLYRQVRTHPEGWLDGQRHILEPIPPVNRFFLQVPLSNQANFRPGADTALSPPLNSGQDGPVFLTIMPIDKGLPTEALAATFQVRSRVVELPLGGVEIRWPDNTVPEGISAQISGRPLNLRGLTLLEPGLHTLTWSGAGQEGRQDQVAISQGRVEILNGPVGSQQSALHFRVPPGAQVWLDGEPLSGESPYTVAPGRRQLRLRWQEYELTKALELIPGQTLRLELHLDLQILSP